MSIGNLRTPKREGAASGARASAGGTPGRVEGRKYEKCLELMNLMADADVLTVLSVRNGDPQYFLLTRKSPYRVLSAAFQRYAQLEELAGFENSHVILMP